MNGATVCYHAVRKSGQAVGKSEREVRAKLEHDRQTRQSRVLHDREKREEIAKHVLLISMLQQQWGPVNAVCTRFPIFTGIIASARNASRVYLHVYNVC